MTILDNKILDIHPKDLLLKNNTRVMSFDNKYDVLEFLKKNDPVKNSEEHTEIFYGNISSYIPDTDKVEKIKAEVLNNLIKRGIITGTIYEGYKYQIEGEIVDYAQLATGNPMCMMTPIKKYDKWFYELYINMSVPGSVDESCIEQGAIRLIETIKALEQRNIEIKINVVDYSGNLYNDEELEHLLVIIPLINHTEHKDYKNLMPFILGSFLRGPLFTIARNSIDNKNNVDSGMGLAMKLNNTVNLWDLDTNSEIELAERIMNDLGINHEV